MKSSYSKTGNRPGKPGFRTQASFVKRFISKLRVRRIFKGKSNIFKSSFFNNKK